MLQIGCSLSFVLEPGDLPGVEHRNQWQQFQRHATLKRQLPSFVNDTHPAAPDTPAEVQSPPVFSGSDFLQGRYRRSGREWARAAPSRWLEL